MSYFKWLYTRGEMNGSRSGHQSPSINSRLIEAGSKCKSQTLYFNVWSSINVKVWCLVMASIQNWRFGSPFFGILKWYDDSVYLFHSLSFFIFDTVVLTWTNAPNLSLKYHCDSDNEQFCRIFVSDSCLCETMFNVAECCWIEHSWNALFGYDTSWHIYIIDSFGARSPRIAETPPEELVCGQ